MPERIPSLSSDFIKNINNYTREEIAYEVINALTDGVIPSKKLKSMVAKAFNFPIPVVQVGDRFVAEQWHGPTLAFKDFGARFMAQLYSYYQNLSNEKITVLTATSGDTGGAVAAAFQEVGDVQVLILYPKNRVSDFQEKQIAGCGDQIKALEVNGSFDDCQRLVKEAFLNQELSQKHGLTSANSINLARLIPQVVYYFLVYKNLNQHNKSLVISVPSGNLGNISAGVIAQKMGCPISRFILATNINDAAVQYLKTGDFQAIEASPTLSNAMDVGIPSNFIRLKELHNHSFTSISNNVSGIRYTDQETSDIIKTTYDQSGYVLDPHSAIGYAALNDIKDGEVGVSMATAHPIKFPDVYKELDIKVDISESASRFLNLSIKKKGINPDLQELIPHFD